MDIIWAIRELCSGECGFEKLFDKEKTYPKLMELSDDQADAKRFAALLYGKARGTLIEMINDVYHYESYAPKLQAELVADGMDVAGAKRALALFYEAFGFPGARHMDQSRLGIVITEDGNFKTEYKGEVRDGKEHGVGVRTCYYDGKWCNYDECVWIDGVMCGYDNAKEVEFGMFEDKKIGFVVDDYFVGNIRIIPAGDYEPFDDTVKKFSVKC